MTVLYDYLIRSSESDVLCNRIWKVWATVYKTPNHWLSDFVRLLKFQITRKHNVSETGSASIFTWGEGDTYFVKQVTEVPLTWGRKQIQCPKRRVFYYLGFRTMDKDQNPNVSEFWFSHMYLLKLRVQLWYLDSIFSSTIAKYFRLTSLHQMNYKKKAVE
jgi:hypothetical protein